MKPVKVAEPTGLGAVATDYLGRIWVRTADGTLPWYWMGRGRDWAALVDPEILSEGHDPERWALVEGIRAKSDAHDCARFAYAGGDAHDCDRCDASGFLILDRVARATGELIDVECPRCRGTGTVR